MNKPVILVTGGAGYIGSHVCKALKQSGFVPVTFDNLSSGNTEAVQWGPLEVGDIRNPHRLSEVINQYKPVAIMHFAALIQVGDSVTDPAEFYENNVIGSYNLLEAARFSGIEHMVFSSTAAVYGIPEMAFIPEDAPVNPINPYGQTKLAMESMIRDYSQAYGLNHVILRYFNAAGADPEGQTGTAYPRDTHLIPLLMRVASDTMDEIKIFGTDYDTPDGSAIRDYIHVTDLADAHVKALQHLLDKGENLTLNLGTNDGQSVRDVIEATRNVTGQTIEARECDRRVGDPAILVADARRAAKALNWTPRMSDIQTIIDTAWNWRQIQLSGQEGPSPEDDLKIA